MALHQLRGPAFAQSTTRFSSETWYFCTVLAQRGPELHLFGLPPTINGPLHAQPKYHTPITLPADKDSTEFTITVPNFVPPGTYSFFVSGLGTVNYKRNPEKLAPAETRLAAVEKIVKENDARLTAARTAQAAAAKALTDVQTAKQDPKAATQAKLAADQALVDADKKAGKMAFAVSQRVGEKAPAKSKR